MTTMDAVVERAEAPWRLTMWMFVLFAGLAFGLAALGLFSLVALDVAHRGREFAIRLALGATRGAILRGVLVRAGWRVLCGLAMGLGVAVIASRAMRGLLFGIAPDDGVTYGSRARGRAGRRRDSRVRAGAPRGARRSPGAPASGLTAGSSPVLSAPLAARQRGVRPAEGVSDD